MTLIKLKAPHQELSNRFNVTLFTVSRIFSAWIVALDVRLAPLSSWPEREDLWGTMSQCFKYSFGNKTTVIIDCLEVFLIDNQICLQEHRHGHRTNTTTLLRCWLGYLLKAQSPTFPKLGEDEHKPNF